MASVLLTKRIEFAAAHRYRHEAWDEAHGHNYLLEVTVAGEVDDATGMVINLTDLKRVLEQVVGEFDHKHLNLDTPYFTEINPTTENLGWVLWRLLAARPVIGRLHRIRVYQDEDLFADINRDLAAQSGTAGRAVWMTRRYHFSAAHRVHSTRLSEAENRRCYGSCGSPHSHGHNYVLAVTIYNAIDPVTGMAVNLQALDQVVTETVIRRFDRQDLNRDREFQASVPTGENFVRLLWTLLVKAIPSGRLERIGLEETREASYEYAGGGAQV